MKSKDQILLEEAYRMVCEAPIEDITKTSQRTGQAVNSKLYSMEDSPWDSTVGRKNNKINKAMFENPKYINYLKQNLFQRVPHKFEIILQDSNIKYKQLIELAGTNPETISVLMTNIGDNPLTPWVMGHRIGHILDWKLKTSPEHNKVGDTPISRYLQTHEDISSILQEYVSIIDPECTVFTTDDADVNHEEIFTRLSPFKSARDENVGGLTEYIIELHAQYLTTGRVDFNNDLPHKKEYSDKATEWMRGYYDSLKGMWGTIFPTLD